MQHCSREVASWLVVWNFSRCGNWDLNCEKVSDESAKLVTNCVVVALNEAGLKVSKGCVAAGEHSECHICDEVAQSVDALQIGAEADQVVVKGAIVVHVKGAADDLKVLGDLAHIETCSGGLAGTFELTSSFKDINAGGLACKSRVLALEGVKGSNALRIRDNNKFTIFVVSVLHTDEHSLPENGCRNVVFHRSDKCAQSTDWVGSESL